MVRPFDENDEFMAGSKRPRDIGEFKLFAMNLKMSQTDDEMRAIAEEGILLKKEFAAWDVFWRELEMRQKRNLGFRAAVLALDLNQAAAAMGTTPIRVKMVMESYAAAEEARLLELQALWDAGTLPDRDVLGDPSEQLLD